jgi:hypothetical protein
MPDQPPQKVNYLFVGGLVAIGFDASGRFLLTVSHSGRGVFEVGTWVRVARDSRLAYPDAGRAIGIGPIDGQVIEVLARDVILPQAAKRVDHPTHAP